MDGKRMSERVVEGEKKAKLSLEQIIKYTQQKRNVCEKEDGKSLAK